MARVERKEHAREREASIVPARPALALPDWMERFENMIERTWAPLLPAFRMPHELGLLEVPPMDVYEEGDELVVKAELPGLAREEIDVTIAGELLTVAGRKEKEEKVERKDYHRLERSSGAFTRTITLPAEVEVEKVTATFKNGVLEIRAPKTPEARSRTRKIAVT